MTRPRDPPSLSERLRERIAAEGPLTFAAFMEAALYDPEGGFYSRSPVGESGDFVTGPHVSSLFGRLLAGQIVEFWELLGRPESFDVVEVGAGDGTLARQIIEALPSKVAAGLRYHAVDRSRAARQTLAAVRPPLEAGSKLEDAGSGLIGCLVANELLDNVPFHRLTGTPDGVAELFVRAEGDRFVLVEGPPSDPALPALAPALEPGGQAAVSPEAVAFIERATKLFERGYLWLCDYGWQAEHPSGGRRTDFVHGYRGHRVEEDVLADPGSRDVTAGVDFDALVRRANDLGLRVWGPVTQRQALLGLGYREWDREARTAQVGATAERRGVDAMRWYSERNRAAQLVDPAGLGGFLVLCLGVGSVPDRPPRSTAGGSDA